MSRTIPLTQGKSAIVDDDVYDAVHGFKWYAHRSRGTHYVQRGITLDRKRYVIQMHHVVIGFPLNSMVVDHINGDGLDNRRENLRHVTLTQNRRNLYTHRAGRLLGATFNKNAGKWMAQGPLGSKQRYLGYFPTEQQAHERYLQVVNA